jgi:hypothetical protein
MTSVDDVAFAHSSPSSLGNFLGARHATPHMRSALEWRPRVMPRARRSRKHLTAAANDVSEFADEPPIPANLEAKINEFLAIQRPEAETSPLSYVSLGIAGRLDLVEPIMNAGGYISVSKRLGIPVDESYLESTPSEASSVKFDKGKDELGSLALGRGLEDRLSATAAAESSGASVSFMQSTSSREYKGPEPVLDSASIAAIGKDIVEIRDDPGPNGERMSLDNKMRVGTILMVACSALAYGHASTRIFELTSIQTAKILAGSLISLHVALAAFAAAIVAPSLSRDKALWGVKVLLSGPLGLLTLYNLGDVNSNSVAAE